MFMLESTLSADQNRVVEQVQAAAGAAGVNLFLTVAGCAICWAVFRSGTWILQWKPTR